MRKTLLIVAAALVAGCASTPQDLMERGTKHTRTFTGTPTEVAACIDRKAERESAAYIVRHRPIEAGGDEVYVRVVGEVSQALAMFRIAADRSAVIWVNPGLLADHEEFIGRISDGC